MCSSQIDSNNFKKIIFIDYDGTLASDDSTVSTQNIEILEQLKSLGYIRVIATGRNLYSINRVIDKRFPIDYLIFSCGNGISSFYDKKIIKDYSLTSNTIHKAVSIFMEHKIDFMLQKKIPDNHHIYTMKINDDNEDFKRRLTIYKGFEQSLDLNSIPEDISQIIAIFKESNRDSFNVIKEKFQGCNIIKSTSPLNHKSLWMEVMPKDVAKGYSANWLCKYLGIDTKETVSVGNDYNDVDLLDFTAKSFVVENSLNSLKEKYTVIRSNNDSCLQDLFKVL